MYSHLTFPEYFEQILTGSLNELEPGYMYRFKTYYQVETDYPNYTSFHQVYSKRVSHFKKTKIGEVRMTKTSKEDKIRVDLFDEKQKFPLLTIEIKLLGNNRIHVSILPF